MRPLLLGDVALAARVLHGLPSERRAGTMERLLAEADCADRHRRIHGIPHPVFGGGSLMAAASRFERGSEPSFDDPDYCRCWRIVLDALSARRSQDRHGRCNTV